MTEHVYNTLIFAMPVMAAIVFVALYNIKAGYGIFRTKGWGASIPNKTGWILMECPAFVVMMWMWFTGSNSLDAAPLVMFLMFEMHYAQRSFIFPLLMKGRSRMPVVIILMGAVFNVINGFLIGESLFHLAPQGKYEAEWLASPQFIAGAVIFFAGMAVNLHSDNVVRNLRSEGDTRHYMPQKGMFRYVTSANYFGELTEWLGFAILTQSAAAWVFVLWTFANLAPRAYAIRRQYISEFGKDVVGSRKCLIPFIY